MADFRIKDLVSNVSATVTGQASASDAANAFLSSQSLTSGRLIVVNLEQVAVFNVVPVVQPQSVPSSLAPAEQDAIL